MPQFDFLIVGFDDDLLVEIILDSIPQHKQVGVDPPQLLIAEGDPILLLLPFDLTRFESTYLLKLHDIELLHLATVIDPHALLGQDVVDYALNRLTDLDLLVEQLGLAVVAGLDIVEDVREEDYLKLVQVEHLRDVEQHLVGVVPQVVLGRLVQDLVRLVGEAALAVLPVQLFVSTAGPHLEG